MYYVDKSHNKWKKVDLLSRLVVIAIWLSDRRNMPPYVCSHEIIAALFKTELVRKKIVSGSKRTWLNERQCKKMALCHMWAMKAKISRRIHTVWSGPSLLVNIFYGFYWFYKQGIKVLIRPGWSGTSFLSNVITDPFLPRTANYLHHRLYSLAVPALCRYIDNTVSDGETQIKLLYHCIFILIFHRTAWKIPIGHFETTSYQRPCNVMTWHSIDVDATLYERHVTAE